MAEVSCSGSESGVMVIASVLGALGPGTLPGLHGRPPDRLMRGRTLVAEAQRRMADGRLFWFAMERRGCAAGKQPHDRHCGLAAAGLPDATRRRPGWARSWIKSYARRHRPTLQPRIGSANVDGKACLILLLEMMADPFRQCSSTMLTEFVIEVSEVRHKR